LLQDGTSKYKSSQIGTRRYKMVQVSTRFPKQVQEGVRNYRMVRDGTERDGHGTRRYSNLIYRKYKYVLVCTGTYWYIPVCTNKYRCRLAQNLNSTLHLITLRPPFDAYESQQIFWRFLRARCSSSWQSHPQSDHPGVACRAKISTATG
jgi:hypothetical protein